MPVKNTKSKTKKPIKLTYLYRASVRKYVFPPNLLTFRLHRGETYSLRDLSRILGCETPKGKDHRRSFLQAIELAGGVIEHTPRTQKYTYLGQKNQVAYEKRFNPNTVMPMALEVIKDRLDEVMEYEWVYYMFNGHLTYNELCKLYFFTSFEELDPRTRPELYDATDKELEELNGKIVKNIYRLFDDHVKKLDRKHHIKYDFVQRKPGNSNTIYLFPVLRDKTTGELIWGDRWTKAALEGDKERMDAMDSWEIEKLAPYKLTFEDYLEFNRNQLYETKGIKYRMSTRQRKKTPAYADPKRTQEVINSRFKSLSKKYMKKTPPRKAELFNAWFERQFVPLTRDNGDLFKRHRSTRHQYEVCNIIQDNFTQKRKLISSLEEQLEINTEAMLSLCEKWRGSKATNSKRAKRGFRNQRFTYTFDIYCKSADMFPLDESPSEGDETTPCASGFNAGDFSSVLNDLERLERAKK